jgi:hypothetical protein
MTQRIGTTLVTFFGLGVIAGTIVVLLAVTVVGRGLHPVRSAYLPACSAEDSDNCLWDAKRSGNGLGTSFVVYNGVYYYAQD